MRPSKTGPERQASLVRVEFDCALHGTVGLYLKPPAHAAVSVSMKRAPSKPLTVSAKQVNKDRLEALDAQYDWHLKAEEEK
jgi:hypothetical protein